MGNETPTGFIIGIVTLGVIMMFVFPLFVGTFTTVDEEAELTGFFGIIDDIYIFMALGINTFIDDVLDILFGESLINSLMDLNSSIAEHVHNYLVAWSLVPTVLAVIILVPTLAGLLYVAVTILKDVIPFT